MTIASGFLTKSGIILCSDSEQTISVGGIDIIKHPTEKSSFVVSKSCVVAFVGAGDSDYIQTAIEEASDGLSACKSPKDIKAHLRKKLIGFFDGHLADFPEKERPAVEFLIGVSTRNGCDLFQYTGRAFHHTDRQAIGIGMVLAENLISDYCRGDETLEDLAKISIYILSVLSH